MGLDPFSWAAYYVASFLIADVGIAAEAAAVLTPLIVYGGAAAALAGAQFLLAPHTPGQQGIDPGAMKDTFETSDSAEIRLVGRGRVAGVKAFGNTNALNRYRLILHCKGEIDAFETFYLGGREVTVEIDGSVSSPPWTDSTGTYAFLYSTGGSGAETAWSYLLADFPGLWASNYRVRGIAQTLAKFISPGLSTAKFLALFQNGAPDVQAVIRGEVGVIDPRTGGPSWSENGIANALHILRSYPELSDLALYDLPQLAAEADRADALTLRKDGSSTKRARAWGFWSSEAARGDTMQQILDSIGGMIVPRLGLTVEGIQQILLGIELVDDVPTAEATIAARHITKLTWYAGPQAVERPNSVTLKYYSPERNYEMTELALQAFDSLGNFTGPAWSRAQSEIDAFGEKPFELSLPFCPDAGQAQQIARRKFAIARAETGTVTTNMAGLAAWGCRFVNIEFPDDGGVSLCMIGPPRVFDDRGEVEIPFLVWPDLAPWNPALDEVAPPAALPGFGYATLSTPAVPICAGVVTLGGGAKETRLGYIIPSDAVTVEATYRVYTSGLAGPWQGMTEAAGSPGTSTLATLELDLTGQTVDFRIRSFNGDSGSDWSALFHVSPMPLLSGAPPAPTITATNVAGVASVLATAPDDVRVRGLKMTGGDAPGAGVEQAIGPAGQFAWSSTIPGTWTAQTVGFDSSTSTIASASL